MSSYEMLIPVKKEDLSVLSSSVPFILKYLKPSRITVVTKGVINQWNQGVFRCLDEDRLLDGVYPEGMTKDTIRMRLEQRIGNGSHAGWYFQQFLKMGYALRSDCPSKYLIWDADTIPLKPIFFEKDGKCIFHQTYECNKAYFLTLRRLFFVGNQKAVMLSQVKTSPYSFIAESMLIQRDVMRSLIKKLELSAPGRPFFENVLQAIDAQHLSSSGFSEFETYGNYFMQNFSRQAYVLDRSVRRFRYGKLLVGETPSNEQIEQLSGLLDVVSFEPGNPFKPVVSGPVTNPVARWLLLKVYWLVRKLIWLKNLVRIKHCHFVD